MPGEKSAILGFAYGFRKNGLLCKSNVALANALRCKHSELLKFPLIMQDGLADCFWKGDLTFIIRNRVSEQHVDTDMIARRGIEAAIELGCTTIYILAYPILHRPLCWFVTRRLAKPHAIKVKTLKTGWIPSDHLSEQWWTRNPFYPFIYTALRVLFSRRGK